MCLGWGAGLPLPLTWIGNAKVAAFPTEQEAGEALGAHCFGEAAAVLSGSLNAKVWPH